MGGSGLWNGVELRVLFVVDFNLFIVFECLEFIDDCLFFFGIEVKWVWSLFLVSFVKFVDMKRWVSKLVFS